MFHFVSVISAEDFGMASALVNGRYYTITNWSAYSNRFSDSFTCYVVIDTDSTCHIVSL